MQRLIFQTLTRKSNIFCKKPLFTQPNYYLKYFSTLQAPQHIEIQKQYDLDVKLLRNTQEKYFVQQFYTGCLAEAAYYIQSKNEVAIIDPLRDVEPYIQLAEENGAEIKYVFLTHFHADFVSGHLELANRTGAKIIYGPTAVTEFDCTVAEDLQKFSLGEIDLQVLHTPGHTQESSTYAILNNNNTEAIFTGDTLFLGEVGRPDLAVKAGTITKEDLASWLYDSIYGKIMSLPDNTLVYPGHGPGSPCGKSIQPGTYDLLGNQKENNYALQFQSKDDFIASVTSDLPIPPSYFGHDVALNKGNSRSTTEIVNANNNPLSYSEFNKAIEDGYIVLDTRFHLDFIKGFVPNSFNVDLGQAFALWVGKLINPDKKFIIICDEGKEVEALTRLCRIGYDNVKGFLQGGIKTWVENGNKLNSVDLVQAQDYEQVYNSNQGANLIDVRNPGELDGGKIENSLNIPLFQLEDILQNNTQMLNQNDKYYITCQRGARGVTAVSILSYLGFKDLANVNGGMNAIKQDTKIPITYK